MSDNSSKIWSMGTSIAESMKADREKQYNQLEKNSERWFQERLAEDRRQYAIKQSQPKVEPPPLPELPIVVPVILPVLPPVQYNIKKSPGGYGYYDSTTLVLCGKTEEGNPVFESKGRSDKVMGRSFIESQLFPIGSKVELTSGDFPIIGYNFKRKKYVMGGKNVSIDSTSNCGKLSLECKITVSAARAGGRRRTKRRGTKRSTRRR